MSLFILNKKYQKINDEVLYTKDQITILEGEDIKKIKELSSKNPRKRIRLCGHLSQENLLHEMIIIHQKDAYIRPHKHIGKSESIHIIEGEVDLIIYNETGDIQQVIKMGEYSSGKQFYCRMATSVYHTLIIRTDFLVFHETTNGPLNPVQTIFADWSPLESDSENINKFMSELDNMIKYKK